MENSWSRLVQAAGLTEEEDGRIVGRLASQLGAALGDHPHQTITNWRVRQRVSLDGALAAQKTYRCDANWLLTGDGARLLAWPFRSELQSMVEQLTPKGLGHVEEVLRSTLLALTDGVTQVIDHTVQVQTDPPVIGTTTAPVRKRRFQSEFKSESEVKGSRANRKSGAVPKSRGGRRA